MITAAILGSILLWQQPAPQSKTFQLSAANLKFEHPASWKIRRQRDNYIVTVPLESKTEARLEVFAVSFTTESAVWEKSQRFIAERERLRILPQEHEVLLGVPLLLIRTQETVSPEQKITLAGMLYAATDYKLAFRLTAPAAVFPEAEAAWREALTTMATIDGKLPEPERPGRATEAPGTRNKPNVAPNRDITRLGEDPNGKNAAIEQVTVKQTVAGKEVLFGVPTGWAIEPGDGKLLVSHPELVGKIAVVLGSTLDSPTMTRTVMEQVANALPRFTAVKRRSEILPKANLVGARILWVMREGESAQGPLTILHAGGEKTDFYWTAEYTLSGVIPKAQLQLLEKFMMGSSVQPAVAP